jgi:hypothetical protein
VQCRPTRLGVLELVRSALELDESPTGLLRPGEDLVDRAAMGPRDRAELGETPLGRIEAHRVGVEVLDVAG